MASYSPKPGASGGPNSKSTYDSFSLLATPSASKPGSRSLTPSNVSRPQLSRSAGSVGQSGPDAFSSLLGPSFTSTTNQECLSLAARRAAAEKEQQAKVAGEREGKQNESAVWSGLDILGQKSLNSSVNNAEEQISRASTDDDWLFDNTAPSTSNPPNPPVLIQSDDDWSLSGFATSTHNSAMVQAHTGAWESVSLFDALDDRNLLPDAFGESRVQTVAGGLNEETDDDILGILGKPIASKPPSPSQLASPAPMRERDPQAQASSPPPHVIGRIVEMGFTPQQARLALASTDTGLDVQQALDILLSNGVGEEHGDEATLDRPRRGLAEYQYEEDRWEERRMNNSRSQRSTARQTASPSVPPNRTQNIPPLLAGGDMQEQADKLLAQASEIGLNMFNRANALWKDGREKVQKAYEERAAKNKFTSDGRPRWMADMPTDEDERVPKGSGSGKDAPQGGVRDDDDIRAQASSSRARQRDIRPDGTTTGHTRQAAKQTVANVFDDEPAVYVSPSRRRPVPSHSSSQTAPFPAQASSPPLRKPQPPLRTRQTVSASTSAIASSNVHKAKGTELYKLGQYANAEQAYSAALDALPADHLLLVPLHNNRALSRIKIGEHSGAIEDCTAVLSIIGPDYHPAREAKITREEEGASVDLGDALLKALRRRADAYEGREKWGLALKDWEAIVACEWSAKMRIDAFAGASRCRKMLSPENDPSGPTPPTPQPFPRPVAPATQQDFKAVEKLHQMNQAQEQEEQAKAGLKDTVDATLNAWKAGKETNVRALVASLETVIWPELGWQKVGLHDLVTPSQVKVRYMRAIAKLHPDKINTGNTTVEQRMIANGVFAALNYAWLAFRQ